MRIERHVFGSFSGYTTLARSPGLTADDAKLLEAGSYAFGQTDDRAYLKGLPRQPAWFTRVLRGGRRGLTRVLEGNPDDNGRPTLLMITAVITQREWDNELCGDVGLLLEDSAIWTAESQDLAPLDRTYPLPSRSVPRKLVPKVLALLAELERRAVLKQSVIVSSAEYGPDELRLTEMLIPPAVRAHLTTGCRSLSGSLSVNVNAVAVEAGTPANLFRFSAAIPPSAYSAFLQSTTLVNGTLPLTEVMGYREFGKRTAAAAPVSVAGGPTQASQAMMAEMPPVRIVSRPSMGLLGGAVAVSLLIGVAGGVFVGKKLMASPSPPASQPPVDPANGTHLPVKDPEIPRPPTQPVQVLPTEVPVVVAPPTPATAPGTGSAQSAEIEQLARQLREARDSLDIANAKLTAREQALTAAQRKTGKAESDRQAAENELNALKADFDELVGKTTDSLIPKDVSISLADLERWRPALQFLSMQRAGSATKPKSADPRKAAIKKLYDLADLLSQGYEIERRATDEKRRIEKLEAPSISDLAPAQHAKEELTKINGLLAKIPDAPEFVQKTSFREACLRLKTLEERLAATITRKMPTVPTK